MRGSDEQQNHVFSYISPEQRVRKDLPLRPIRTMVDEILNRKMPMWPCRHNIVFWAQSAKLFRAAKRGLIPERRMAVRPAIRQVKRKIASIGTALVPTRRGSLAGC
jgi:hypothetical protein